MRIKVADFNWLRAKVGQLIWHLYLILESSNIPFTLLLDHAKNVCKEWLKSFCGGIEKEILNIRCSVFVEQ